MFSKISLSTVVNFVVFNCVAYYVFLLRCAKK